MGDEGSVLQWGGLGGLLSGILMILALITVITVITLLPAADAREMLMLFPEAQAGIFLYYALRLAAVAAAVPLFLALYRALRGASPAPALTGTGLAMISLPLLAFGAALSIIQTPLLHTLYTEAATDVERTTVVFLWQATLSIFSTARSVGGGYLSLAFIVLGVAMFGSPNFGRGYGSATVVLGAIGVIATVLSPGGPAGIAIGLAWLILLLLITGWKTYSLSRSPSRGGSHEAA